MTIHDFGRIGTTPVHEIRLATPSGATASIVTVGAALRDLVVPLADGTPRRVVLGCETLAGYHPNPAHLGAMVGRIANRIGGARFRLDGRDWSLPVNDAGRNCLHGGPDGFTTRVWSIEAASEAAVTLALVSEDGDAGFPGRTLTRVGYALSDPATLTITAETTADRPTPVNIANHAYLTLADGADCRAHRLRIAADAYLAVDETKVPTGAVLPVADSDFDFREARPISGDYDIPLVLSGAPGEITLAAEATAPDGRLRLELSTDQPCLQLYTGQYLGPTDTPLGGIAHVGHAAFCLEAQGLVDAPNQRHFASILAAPGHPARQTTVMRFVAL